jgi:DNA-binding transcriptional LysR family regulator
VRVGITVIAARFLSSRLPTLLADHPGLKVELVVSDRVGDMIKDRLDLAVRAGDITDAALMLRKGWTFEPHRRSGAELYRAARQTFHTSRSVDACLHHPQHRTEFAHVDLHHSHRPAGCPGLRRISRQ